MRVKRNRGDGWLGVLIALVEFIIAGIRFLIVKVREFTKNAQMGKKQQSVTTDSSTED